MQENKQWSHEQLTKDLVIEPSTGAWSSGEILGFSRQSCSVFTLRSRILFSSFYAYYVGVRHAHRRLTCLGYPLDFLLGAGSLFLRCNNGEPNRTEPRDEKENLTS
jgi:hypothetical protein